MGKREDKIRSMARNDAKGVGNGGRPTGGGYARAASVERKIYGSKAYVYEQEYRKTRSSRKK